MNNVVRVALQALAAVLGGTQSLHTNGFDEALALPTERSATLALRTQQILAHETGVPEVVDPFGGSWYVEQLTDQIERDARTLIEEVEQSGGAVAAIERGVFQDAIARSAYGQQAAVEREDAIVVGVNRFTTGDAAPALVAPDYSALAADQRRRVAEVRSRRDGGVVERLLGELRAAAKEHDAPLLPTIVDCVRARGTVGEISDVLRGVWGTFDPQ
jgi:methylmalonyl-CoA mutase N-terminal domain/subunit